VRISTRAEYALRALAELAIHPDRRFVKAAYLAEQQGIPRTSLQFILWNLSRAGLLVARSGTDGGFQFRRPPEEITVEEVIQLIDGPTFIGDSGPNDIKYYQAFPGLENLWTELNASISTVLSQVSVADLHNPVTRSNKPAT
jgi:Rrf2 family protein